MINSSASHKKQRVTLLLALLLYGLGVAFYFVARYGMLWSDNDSSGMAVMINTVSYEGTVFPEEPIYPHGFAFQALATFLMQLTGISVQTLQSLVWPFLAVIGVIIFMYAFYTLAVKDYVAGALAVLLLFFQGDYLFVTLRGSHEKLDWPLMVLALILLLLSVGGSLRSLLTYVCLFYLVVFALMTVNLFFASTFVFAVTVSLFLGLVILVISRNRSPLIADLRRLLYVALACFVLFFMVVFYIYPPALHNLQILGGFIEQVGVAALGFEALDVPYNYINYGWTDSRLWFGLTLFTWLLILFSFIEWVRWGWQNLKEWRLGREPRIKDVLLWLLYAGFAIQVFLGVILSSTGFLFTNLQLRIFPGFTVMAVALLARGLIGWFSGSQFNNRIRPVLVGCGVILVFWFSIAAVFKATNEPLLSNKWGFYDQAEMQGVSWFDIHAESTHIWTGVDERLREAYAFQYADTILNSSNTLGAYRHDDYESYVLISEREKLRAARMGIAMPPVLMWNQLYDGGEVSVYRKVAQTPYQR